MKTAISTYIILVLITLVSFSGFAQKQSKKKVTEADYTKWGRLENESISDDGKWASFTMHYDEGQDTLFVKGTSNKKMFTFPGGTLGKFAGKDRFACLQDDVAVFCNLNTGAKIKSPDTASFELTVDGKYMVTFSNSGKLSFWNDKGIEVEFITDVSEYKFDSITNTVCYITELKGSFTLGTVNLNILKNKAHWSTTNKLSDLTVSEYGGGLFVLEQGDDSHSILHYFEEGSSIPKTFNPQQQAGFPEGYKITPAYSFRISPDSKRVFCCIQKIKSATLPNSANVEVWDTEDKWIYPKAKQADLEHAPRLIAWFPQDNSWQPITDEELPYIQLNGDKTKALLYNPVAYAPHFKKYGETDYYLYDIDTKTKFLFLKKQPGENEYMHFSPDGKYISYFREGDWWLYIIGTKEHFCIKNNWDQWSANSLENSDRPNVPGFTGWSIDGKSLVINSVWDVFQFDINNKALKRCTVGKEKNKRFKVDYSSLKRSGLGNYNGWDSPQLDLEKGIILFSVDGFTKARKFHTFDNSGNVKQLNVRIGKEDEMRFIGNRAIVYREQSYDMPPRLISVLNGKEQVLSQSNNHSYKYDCGKVDLISLRDPTGGKSEGLLYYPANYQQGKKYPMIVDIYSVRSWELHDYINPTHYDQIGFNIRNFVLKGYFVLAPDIHYIEGQTGKCALDYVNIAVDSVIATGMVDDKRIGLTGHSFGGYETNFIVTQTNRYAAAVAGAAVNDLVSWGFTINPGLKIPELWRSEIYQWRIGKAFYQDKEMYFRNSPIFYAENMNTPLLTWAGKKETNIPYEQGIYFYNALRRAGKKNVFLLYPDEDHAIVGKVNQKDLTTRIEAWFDKYLKPEL